MKTILTVLALISTLSISFSQVIGTKWANVAGSSGVDNGNSVIVDASNNVYTTGSFSGTVDFDPSGSTQNLVSNGLSDVFLQKVDQNGNLLWVKSFGGSIDDVAKTICLDQSGAIYIAGYFSNTVDFNPNAGVTSFSSNGLIDAFIEKFDENGNMVWTKTFGGTGNDQIFSIMNNAFNDIVYSGSFESTIDADPNVGVTSLTSNGATDILMGTMNISGNLIWAFSEGGTGFEFPLSIDGNSTGEIFITGYYSSTMDFDPGVGVVNIGVSGSEDAFLQKVGVTGSYIWAKRIGAAGSDVGRSVKVDLIGDVYFSGTYWSSAVDLDPGAGVVIAPFVANRDAFIIKLNTSGDYLWSRTINSNGTETPIAMEIDASNNIYTVGTYQTITDFNPNVGVFNLPIANVGQKDVFIQVLDESGNFIIAKSLNSQGNNDVSSICIDAVNNVYIAGSYTYTCDFDLGPSVINKSSVFNTADIFSMKIGQCATTYGTDVVAACEELIWLDGNTYTTNNSTATHSISNAAGCDSIITLNLTIIYPVSADIYVTSCGPYTWNGTTYNSSANVSHTTLGGAANGCDSTSTLILTVNTPQTPTATINATSDSICQGESVIFAANLTNEGASPTYAWYLNGSVVSSSSSYSTSALANNDELHLDLTSNASCLTVSNAVSDTITMVVGVPGGTPSISISASNTSICDGDQVTFSTTIFNGGNYPNYYWEVNGLSAGTNSSQFISSNLNDGDQIFCSLISSDGCLLITQSGSNIIDMTVSTVETPEVTISGPTTLCVGENAIYQASGLGEGSSPIYNWYVNSNPTPVGSGMNLTINSLVQDDTVRCVLINNDPCATVNFDISNEIVVSVLSSITPTIVITTTGQTSCDGDGVIFTSNVTGEGSLPGYQWLLNGSNINGEISSTFSSNSLTNQDQVSCILGSSLSCAVVSSVTSNVITTSINPLPENDITQNGITLTADQNSADYVWIDCANNMPITNATSQSFTPTANGNYAVVVSNATCSDTSICFSIASVGIDELNQNSILVYPNPSNGIVNISSSVNVEKWTVRDLFGKIITEGYTLTNDFNIDLSEYPKGVYFLEISHENNNPIIKKITLQ